VDPALLDTPLLINLSPAMIPTNAPWAHTTAMVFLWAATTRLEALHAAHASLVTLETVLVHLAAKTLTSAQIRPFALLTPLGASTMLAVTLVDHAPADSLETAPSVLM